MDALDKEIAYNIKRVAGVLDTASPRHPIMSGVVKSVNEGELTCTVLLTVDGGEPTEGVLLGTMPDNGSGLVLVPKENSKVLVAEIDGPGRWTVIRATELEKVLVSADVVIEMNGGENGGVPKAAVTAERIKRLEDKMNALGEIILGWTPVANDGGAALKALFTASVPLWTNPISPLTVAAHLENDKVTH